MGGVDDTSEDVGSVELVDWDDVVERLHNLESDDVYDTMLNVSGGEYIHEVTVRAADDADALWLARENLRNAADAMVPIRHVSARLDVTPDIWHVTVGGPAALTEV